MLNKLKKIKTIVICGPTASGKTNLSFILSQLLDIEIISADSRQIYKYINIGTAKPTQQELAKLKHHFIDLLELNENYSAGEYGNQAYDVLQNISKNGKVPVIVGGSGLYIKSLCEGLFDENNHINMEIRKQLEAELLLNGIDDLYEKLKIIDKPLYELYNDKNPRRILRALEYYYSNGIKLSEARTKISNRELIAPIYFAINFPRPELYERINQRVDEMWEMGLAEETENILNLGYSENLNSLNTVGYKETIAYLKGDIPKDLAIEEMKKNTRHYAKRQGTWLNQIPNINFIQGEELNNTVTINNLLKKIKN